MLQPGRDHQRHGQTAFSFSRHQELSMDLSTSTVLVTGANRGFGRALAVGLLAAGAYEILADNASRQAQAALAMGVPALYPQLFAKGDVLPAPTH
jgi:NAD(P)-dependent dehydrogenase (short-subunit alcohol dehydrogenase family)